MAGGSADGQVEVSRRGHASVVALRGEFDVSTVGSLRRALDDLPDSERAVVDLEGCTFLDSTAVSALVSALRRQRGAGGDLALARPGPRLERILVGVLALDQVMEVHRSLEEAVGPPPP